MIEFGRNFASCWVRRFGQPWRDTVRILLINDWRFLIRDWSFFLSGIHFNLLSSTTLFRCNYTRKCTWKWTQGFGRSCVVILLSRRGCDSSRKNWKKVRNNILFISSFEHSSCKRAIRYDSPNVSVHSSYLLALVFGNIDSGVLVSVLTSSSQFEQIPT